VDMEAAEELLESVNKFAEIFWETKGVKTARVTAPYPTEKRNSSAAAEMIQRYKVKGHSMEPAFSEGDKIVTSSLFFGLKKGDVIVFNHNGRVYLKRVKINRGTLVVAGDNKGHTGEWEIARSQVKGKYLMKYSCVK